MALQKLQFRPGLNREGTIYSNEGGWYDGNNENEPAPYLNIKFPRGWCGAIDFGRLDNGKICLVESQHPFACGWYGEDSSAYVTWLIEGWKYMLSQSF